MGYHEGVHAFTLRILGRLVSLTGHQRRLPQALSKPDGVDRRRDTRALERVVEELN